MSAFAPDEATGPQHGGGKKDAKEGTDQRGMRSADYRGKEGEQGDLYPEARLAALDGRFIAQPETIENIKPRLADWPPAEFQTQQLPPAVRSVAEGTTQPAGSAADGIDLSIADLDDTAQVAGAPEMVDDKVAALFEGGQGIETGTGVAVAVCQPPCPGCEHRADGSGGSNPEKTGSSHVSPSACGRRHGQSR